MSARTSREADFITHDGETLFYRHWPATGPRCRGAIVLLHRGHEHSARVAHLVDELDLPDFAFFAWDARGHGTITRTRRVLKRPWKKEPYELAVLKRLVVAIRLRDGAHLMIKMFKNIPLGDLEALMPHARVKMGPRELLTTLASGGGAVWTIATKLIATGLAAAGTLLYVLAAPLAALSWRTFRSYRRALKDRDSDRTKHLYYQNLANNASAIHMLATGVGQEEVKEALLIYSICAGGLAEQDGVPVTAERIAAAVEDYLQLKFGIDVEFDIPDAIETIDRLGLWEDRGRFRVLPPASAMEVLSEHRRERQSAGYHLGLVSRETMAASQGESAEQVD